jgi:histone acetyltransferase (RNA polymerase elongator complex component)
VGLSVSVGRIVGLGRLLVLSGLGVRECFRRFGYRCNGVYMEKRLK